VNAPGHSDPPLPETIICRSRPSATGSVPPERGGPAAVRSAAGRSGGPAAGGPSSGGPAAGGTGESVRAAGTG
jgi:hypothetical protein